VLAAAILCLGTTLAPAEEGSVSWKELDASIEEVVAGPEYAWRMPRERPGADARNPVAKFFRDLADGIMGFFEEVADEVDRILGWLRKWLGGRQADRNDPAGSSEVDWERALRGLVYVLAGLVVAMIAALAVRAYRRRGRGDANDDGAGARGAAVDLESEEIVASQLPEDEWISLARQQIEKGEFRLAVRALFLASLARLGELCLVRVEKSKSNMDYERELGRRVKGDAEMMRAFVENVGIFERAWYGLHGVSEEVVQHFLENYRRITSDERAGEHG